MTVEQLITALRLFPGHLDVELLAHPAYEDEIVVGVTAVEDAFPLIFCGQKPCKRVDKLTSVGKPSRARPNGDHWHTDRVVRVSADG